MTNLNFYFRMLSRALLVCGFIMGMGMASFAQSDEYFDKTSGVTMYPQDNGGMVVYIPTDDGAIVLVCPGPIWGSNCYQINCHEDPKGCRDALDTYTKSRVDMSKYGLPHKGAARVNLNTNFQIGNLKWK